MCPAIPLGTFPDREQVIWKITSQQPIRKGIQPKEGFLNPLRHRLRNGRILPVLLTATRRRPQRSRTEETMLEPGSYRRQQREDFSDARWGEQEAAKRTGRTRSGKSMD
ncbi:hypothetical protein NDU88_001934 [Pleurodeles waltl]|uniref:Uncharacterized protein n=1 Tax=Pleurodeles waltl TaxID=8319 RepID=A0AAV7KT81_PLEWA|nr:hypothetical protein NDU88_001934 [Pleurodeles waltl]